MHADARKYCSKMNIEYRLKDNCNIAQVLPTPISAFALCSDKRIRNFESKFMTFFFFVFRLKTLNV